MAIQAYQATPILVDLGKHPTANVLLRARRVYVNLPDEAARPCVLQVELIPYQLLDDGSYGPEYTGGIFTRKMCKPLVVENIRLVDATTGRILASRLAADNTYRPIEDWQADVARLDADESVHAMYQADWFNYLMDNGLPEPIRVFVIQYIQLAWANGDLL